MRPGPLLHVGRAGEDRGAGRCFAARKRRARGRACRCSASGQRSCRGHCAEKSGQAVSFSLLGHRLPPCPCPSQPTPACCPLVPPRCSWTPCCALWTTAAPRIRPTGARGRWVGGRACRADEWGSARQRALMPPVLLRAAAGSSGRGPCALWHAIARRPRHAQRSAHARSAQFIESQATSRCKKY